MTPELWLLLGMAFVLALAGAWPSPRTGRMPRSARDARAAKRGQ